MKEKQKPKVALVYDRVNTPHGGAEKLLTVLHQLYPDAPLYTSLYDHEQAKWADIFEVRSSFLQHFPLLKRQHRLLAWLMPIAFESLDLGEFDLVISVTSAEAKGIITRSDQLHVCYLLTPTRYLYSHKRRSLRSLFKKRPFTYLPTILTKLLNYSITQLLDYLQTWDQIAAQRPDVIIPISKLVQQRCEHYYGRKTKRVIYPTAVDGKFGQANTRTTQKPDLLTFEPYYVVISRLVHYKRVDLAIRACQKLQKNLLIIGEGPERNKLEKLAERQKGTYLIKFLGSVSESDKRNYLANCKALLVPGVEDFGITALEAAQIGTPVVLQKASGVAEILQKGGRVVTIQRESVAALGAAMKRVKTTQGKQARRYNTSYFSQQFSSTIQQVYETFI